MLPVLISIFRARANKKVMRRKHLGGKARVGKGKIHPYNPWHARARMYFLGPSCLPSSHGEVPLAARKMCAEGRDNIIA